jgi:molecular chaperone HscB
MGPVRISPATLRSLRAVIADTSTTCCPRNSPPPHYHTYYAKAWRRQFSHSTIRQESPAYRTLESLIEDPPKTHFDFFPSSIPHGPPPSGPFALDLSSLRNEFLRLQAQAHPDRHPPGRRTKAQALSARINEAYRALQSPLKRAEYLLELRGARVQGDEERVLGQEEGDEDILMEVMEAREAAEQATGEDEIRVLREENRQRMDGVIASMEDAFRRDDLIRAKRELVRLSYWAGVEDRLREGHGNH